MMRTRLVLLGVLLLVACTGSHPPTDSTAHTIRWSACTGSTFGQGDAAVLVAFGRRGITTECAYTASCDAYLSCLGIDESAPCEWPDEPRCDGSVQEFCEPRTRRLVRQDCAADPDNPVCTLSDTGFPECSSGVPCDASLSSRCDGNTRVWCNGRVEDRYDCGEDICHDTGERAVCVDRVEACETDRCDGQRLVTCVAGVAVLEEDCANRFGATVCIEDAEGARCASTSMECEPGSVECVGAVARVCVEGTWIDHDCGSFQGARCVEEPDERLRCVID